MGFTIGASVLIANSQVGTALGLQFKKSTAIADTFSQLADQVHMTDWLAFLGAVSTLLLILFFERFSKRIPSMFLGLITSALLVNLMGYLLDHPGVQSVSALPSALPIPSWPIPNQVGAQTVGGERAPADAVGMRYVEPETQLPPRNGTDGCPG